MSLINEALKRARLEAARRDASEKGVPAAALPTYLPPRRKPWLAPLLGFLGGIAVVGIAAGAFWWMRAEPSSVTPSAAVAHTLSVTQHVTAQPAAVPDPVPTVKSEVPAPEVPPPAVEAVSQPAAPQPATPQPAAPQPATPQPATPQPATPQPATTSLAQRVEPAAEPTSPTRAGQTPEPVVAKVETPPRPTATAPAASGSYLREATLAGGQTLKLDFIVWSEARPFAQINGELVNPGEMIEGYVLRHVERDRVELEGSGGSIWLRVN